MDWPSLNHQLTSVLADKFGSDIQIQTVSPLSGGDSHQAYQLHTNRENFFLKTNSLDAQPCFATEAHSLTVLAETLSILVPKVIGYSGQNIHPPLAPQESTTSWLLLEYLPLQPQGDDTQRGKDLALLHHQIHHSDAPFGWLEENYLGHTRQNNAWQTDWVTFYRENRLKPQFESAKQKGASQKLLDLGETLEERLDDFFHSYQPKASPLHGDLWGGNSAFLPSGEAVFYDPASYYGDRETDLAMTELFGGFSPAFYQGYQSVFPLDKGYENRKSLYNLYHILNHYTLFGEPYATQAINLIEKLLTSIR